MKKLLLTAFLLLNAHLYSQDYKLVPDSCTYCAFLVSTGGPSWYSAAYGIFPSLDTTVLGNEYMKVGADYKQAFGIRQVGNKLFGVVADSLNEMLLMDFDANIGDTIENLYSDGFYYKASVLEKDSILENNGVYHHYMNLQGIQLLMNGVWTNYNWQFQWNERGLCAAELGGVHYNVPVNDFVISILYAYPGYCTTDPIYTNHPELSCDNCNLIISAIKENWWLESTISPNPVLDEIFISFDQSTNEPFTYSIENALGESVVTGTVFTGGETIDVTTLKPGVYLVRCSTLTGEKKSRARFVKS
jgi:Secretion system C-terminal sorting domain